MAKGIEQIRKEEIHKKSQERAKAAREEER
jgi:hypothetical protein